MDIQYVELKDDIEPFDNTIIETKPPKPVEKPYEPPKIIAKPIEYKPDRYTNLI